MKPTDSDEDEAEHPSSMQKELRRMLMFCRATFANLFEWAALESVVGWLVST